MTPPKAEAREANPWSNRIQELAPQLLKADADLVTIQDPLGHTRIKTTQRYVRISNVKVQRDYYKAMEVILQKAANEKREVLSMN